MKCLWCKNEFRQTRRWHKFCKPDCRIKFNQKCSLGYVLPPILERELSAAADGLQLSNIEMLCKILHQAFNPEQAPLTDADIFGIPDTKEAG